MAAPSTPCPPTWRTGKSGALRVCYAHLPKREAVYFVAVFGKSQQANLSDDELNAIRTMLRELEK